MTSVRHTELALGFSGQEGVWDGDQAHSTDALSVPIVVP